MKLSVKKVWSLILQDVAERQVSVLVSSHNLRELEVVCDHIGILHNGKIVVERELDDMKSDVHKFQLAFSAEIPEGFLEGPEVLHRTQTGSILLLIVRGDKNELLQKMKLANPVILDVLPLTHEEIFIYELGGMGYEYLGRNGIHCPAGHYYWVLFPSIPNLLLGPPVIS